MILFNIIATLVIGLTIYRAFCDFRKDTSLLKNIYFSRPKDFLWSALMVLFVFLSLPVVVSIVPDFMNWSWLNLIVNDSSSKGNNIMAAPFRSGSKFIIIGFWLIISLALPYLAKVEEKAFRSFAFSTRKRILNSLVFGVMHMIMGVPLSICLILAIIGYIFSIFYVKSFRKMAMIDAYKADEYATNVSTSVHAKYNFIIFTVGTLLILIFS